MSWIDTGDVDSACKLCWGSDDLSGGPLDSVLDLDTRRRPVSDGYRYTRGNMDAPTTNWTKVGSMAQQTGAGLTFLAIGVALIKESILRLLRHLELMATLEPRQPDCIKTPLTHGDWAGSRYFLRLWIENLGKVRATDVEVFISRASNSKEKPSEKAIDLRLWASGGVIVTSTIQLFSPRVFRQG